MTICQLRTTSVQQFLRRNHEASENQSNEVPCEHYLVFSGLVAMQRDVSLRQRSDVATSDWSIRITIPSYTSCVQMCVRTDKENTSRKTRRCSTPANCFVAQMAGNKLKAGRRNKIFKVNRYPGMALSRS